ncbi:hypothetical protein L226DRAFT_286903 [Lentinus tigrinus ALCF2SS1-7]|uniref:uncharacterized protein n=1 Tax=Lentinus tigrinus ALCF2SS1-7 TaxID=1328758 RepID=UPI00116606E5|nr:hypothetical protein L226DRAFT_286903 [Lentinus tigrinus ALCF2SS1-7]
MYEPRGASPTLPLEILHIIAAHADGHSLTQLCLANSVVGDVAAFYLYMDLRLRKPITVVKCLKTISKHPELGRRVRVLSIHLHPKVGPHFTIGFGKLLRCALHNVTQLISLELILYGHRFGRYLLGCPARIKNVSLACDWDADLDVWFREQPAIQRLIFHGNSHPAPTSMHPSALPELQCIFAQPSVISHFVPGRPVKRVFVTVDHPRVFSGPAMEAMARSCK